MSREEFEKYVKKSVLEGFSDMLSDYPTVKSFEVKLKFDNNEPDFTFIVNI